MNNPQVKSKPFLSLIIVEDSNEDFEAFFRLMKSANFPHPISRYIDGDDILDFLYYKGEYTNREKTPYPTLIVMDLNLPGTDGREVIAILKQDPELKVIPIVALTTSSNPIDIQTCYQYGVNSYLQKPIGTLAFKKLVQDFKSYWFDAVILPSNEE